mgnify:CR=1 FL=1
MTTNAQELWASTNHFRREGGPGMPLQMEHPRNNNTSDPFVNYGWDRPHAAAILRDHRPPRKASHDPRPEHGHDQPMPRLDRGERAGVDAAGIVLIPPSRVGAR